MVKILEGIYAVKHSPADGLDLEGYIIDCGENLILVDTGFTPHDLEAYENELEDVGRDWNEIDTILITHAHGDHIENLPQIKAKTGADVMAGIGDVEIIEERTSVGVDRGLKHGDIINLCGGMEAVLVPGHSDGNMSFYLPTRKVMMVGDTIFGDEKGNLYAPPEKYCKDVEMAAREIRRLLDYDFDVLLISHGKNLMKNAKIEVIKLCREILD